MHGIGLAIMMLTGCFDSSVVGDWEIREFQRFELNGSSYSSSDEEGALTLESNQDVVGQFAFSTAEFGRLAWDVVGVWRNDGGGVYGLVIGGDIRFTDRYGVSAALDVEGEWTCRPDGDLMECQGTLNAPQEADESYRFEIEWERPVGQKRGGARLAPSG